MPHHIDDDRGASECRLLHWILEIDRRNFQVKPRRPYNKRFINFARKTMLKLAVWSEANQLAVFIR